MHFNFLAFAVPLFIFLMLIEYYFSKKKQNAIFHFEEAVANLNIGIAERLTDMFSAGMFYFYFDWLYKQFAFMEIKPTLITWALLFVLTDFIWYWYHRFGHTVTLLWAAHVVHHQSDDFNYTTSVRITFFQSVARSLFWSFLPVLGFPPIMITIFLLVHGAYPFFTHTQLIGKLGFLEKFLVTPSHHRVHHSSNELYLDKNYGDILIIWDKIFGTFAEENEAPVYGLTKPLHSYSFLWQMFHFPLEIIVALSRTKGLSSKLKILFGKPDNIDPDIRELLERKFKIFKGSRPGQLLVKYIKGQTIVTLIIVFLTILFENYLWIPVKVCIGIFILVSLVNTGAMLEQRKWIFYLEYIRLAVLAVLLLIIYPGAFSYFVVVLLSLLCFSFNDFFYRIYCKFLFGM